MHKMRALILTEGGQEIGFGHITRSLALNQAFKEKGIQSTIWVRGDSSLMDLFKGQLDLVSDWLKVKSKTNTMIKRSDVVVIDSYQAPLKFFRHLSRQCLLPVYLDDYKRLAYPRGVIVNGSIGAEYLCYARQKRNLHHLLGIPYALLRETFMFLPSKKIKQDIRNILITFGGIDQTDLIAKITQCLNKRFPRYQFHVVTPKRCKSFSLSKNKLFFYHGLSAAQIKQLMLHCDVAISGGGQTLNELAACGLPTIGIRFATNQRLNIYGWKKMGFLKYAGVAYQPNILQGIERSLIMIQSSSSRQAMSRRGQILVDAKGAQRIVESIINMLFSFERIQKNDSRRIFQWSNDPEVRKASFNPARILWKDHCRWFHSMLHDSSLLFFKIMFSKIAVGQIRFKKTMGRATISISIAKPYRGKGIGATIIRLACQKVFCETKIHTIDAYVKVSNPASLKSFIDAGFLQFGTKIVKNQITHHLILKK